MKKRNQAVLTKPVPPPSASGPAGVPQLLAEAYAGLDATLVALRSALELSSQGGRASLEDLARQCESLVHGLNVERRRRAA